MTEQKPEPLTDEELTDLELREDGDVSGTAVRRLVAEVRRLRGLARDAEEGLRCVLAITSRPADISGGRMYERGQEVLAALIKHRDGKAAATSLLSRENSDGSCTPVAEVRPLSIPPQDPRHGFQASISHRGVCAICGEMRDHPDHRDGKA